MSIRVALYHRTSYRYERAISLGPQVVRLKPAPHCRTPILSYSQRVRPAEHFCNWQQDPHGNFVARLVFPEKTRQFEIEIDLVADMTVINPFDFFVDSSAETWPFRYSPSLERDLRPFLETEPVGPKLRAYLKKVDRSPARTVDALVRLNQQLQQEIGYVVRLEPGIQACDETLTLKSGSCRDSAWLLVQICRNLGLAARFVSGYLIQLQPDVLPLDGPAGAVSDFTDLHAWTEVFLPGAGWIGMDPTSGMLAGEGHLPLAATPDPTDAAPIQGGVEPCETEFEFDMSISRIYEDARVTKPYTDPQWDAINAAGHEVDARLQAGDVRLTMGGEPTFVSVDDMEGAEWNTAAVGPNKRRLASELLHRVSARFAKGALLHFGQGKWYPGESLPRWAFGCYWRLDGEPIWSNPDLYADITHNYGYGPEEAERFTRALAGVLDVGEKWVRLAYEDPAHYLARESVLPINVDPADPKLDDPEERARMVATFERGLSTPRGCVLPLRRQWWQSRPVWVSGPWPVRKKHLTLMPGDSPIGLRLPLDSLPYVEPAFRPVPTELDPLEERTPLPPHPLREQQRTVPGAPEAESLAGVDTRFTEQERETELDPELDPTTSPARVVRTALCVEAREGRIHVFMPPLERLEDYLDLLAALEVTAMQTKLPVVIEGYLPPRDPRIQQIQVTPDPGVIEVNVHPAQKWDELVGMISDLYEDARITRLGTEKFDLDGRHTGTGGGNHVVLGGATPADSPFLRRPDLLRSLLGYWNNHPSLSYLFSGTFVGPTSQAPRVDEGRQDSIYELEIAFNEVPDGGYVPPWLVDRTFRNLLVDITGNTHRAEFCIDKLYSPDSASGRLGLVELRAFEMPPHSRMSLVQQLLIRALVVKFWEQPYRQKLVRWGTSLHDRFLLPYFVWQDLRDVMEECRQAGLPLELDWLRPQFEFRFPKIGETARDDIHLELRQAIEPWYVLGEEPSAGGTSRFVDSSVERLQVRVKGLVGSRHAISCNGRKVPLHPTGVAGEYVAAVRYRAWQPPRCLHPNIPIHTPLVFDIVDLWQEKSLGGCTYYVAHPAGRDYRTFPVNAYEAESRRAARFVETGHTPGVIRPAPTELNPEYPLTLDLRRPSC